jgi:hypothetical protein
LIDYTLEPNPDAGEDKSAPPQKLALAFSTAAVVILGWRLGRLADLLRGYSVAGVLLDDSLRHTITVMACSIVAELLVSA